MKVKNIVTITDEDYDLLNGYLPDNPCEKCCMCAACCGCSEGRDYNKTMKPIKDNGLLEAAKAVKSVKDSENEISVLKTKIKRNKEQLAELGFDLERLFPKKDYEINGTFLMQNTN